MQHDTMCVLPWVSLSLDGPGRPRICCNNSGHWQDFTEPFVTEIADAEAALNSTLHKAVRQSMLRGEQHASCAKCWRMEDTGAKSFRQIWNDVFADITPQACDQDGRLTKPDIRYLDLTFGNKCNLTCRMCNWSNSHLWLHDAAKLGRLDFDLDPREIEQDWFESHSSLRLLYATLPSVTHINFLGGEPLIIKQHLDILRECVVRGIAAGMHISYNTNLTNVSIELLELWQHFGKVAINVSLEALDRANDYIRQNSDWKTILTNLRKVEVLKRRVGNIKLEVHCTFGILNALYVADLLMWCQELHGQLPFVNLVYHPSHQDVRLLPLAAKAEVRRDISQALHGSDRDQNHGNWMAALRYMDQDSSSVTRHSYPGWPDDPWLQFWHDNDEIDLLKNRQLKDYLPRLEALRP